MRLSDSEIDRVAVFGVFRCIRLQFGGEECQSEGWSWLADNQLSLVVNTKESRSVDVADRLSVCPTSPFIRDMFLKRFLCLMFSVLQMRPGVCCLRIWTGFRHLMVGSIAASLTSFCLTVSLFLIGW